MKSLEHDLRAPIAAIEGYTRMIIEGAADEKTRWRLAGVLASCRILEHLIENMRLARTIEEGTFKLGEPGGDADTIIRRVADGLARAFESKRSTIRVVPDEVRLARGAMFIERVAASFLLAALNTSAESVDVEIGVSRVDGQIRIAATADGVAGPGPGACVELVAEAARRLGGHADVGAGRLALSIPERFLV